MRHRRLIEVLVGVMAFALAIAVFDAGMLIAQGGQGDPPSRFGALSLPLGAGVPAAAGTDLRGRRVTVASFEGRPLVVDFFGSWCAPCNREAAVFSAVARRFRGRVSLLAVAVSDSANDDRDFAAKHGWTWPIVEDPGYRWALAFDVLGVPSTYVLDRRGRVVDRVIGPITGARLDRDLNRLLAR